MSKPTKPQRPPTKDEMVQSLSRLEALRPHLILPHRDDDDPFEMMKSVIEELLIHRHVIEKRRNFDQQWLQETAKR